MKIISLNVWGGRQHESLLAFFKEHQNVDVFCLQEVYHEAEGKDTIWKGANFNTLRDLQNVLPDHEVFYHPHLEDWWGLAMFVKKGIPVKEVGEEFVHLYKRHNLDIEVYGHTAKNLQYLKTSENGKELTILNFHGLWNGKGKTDSSERLDQSRKIVEHLSSINHDVVLCGDFNLLPETESIQIIQNSGLRNLIAEYGVTSTRTELYSKPDKFADYAFVSQGLSVKEFTVLPDIVSDHSPLLIEVDALVGTP